MEDNSSQINLAPPKKGVNRLWMILILIAIFAIVGLVSAIIIINQNLQGPDPNSDLTVKNCDEYTSYDIIQACINQNFSNNGDLDEYYSNAKSSINTSIERNDQSTAQQLAQTASYFFAERNRCSMAQDLLNSISLESFSNDQKQSFFKNASEVSTYCEDDASYQKWDTLYQSLNQKEANENA